MGWRENEIRERVLSDLLAFKEICGEEKFIDLLDQELARERVTRRVRESARAEARSEGRIADLEEQLETATQSLEFYADAANYETASGRTCAVVKDKGGRARHALEAISDEAGDGEGE